MYSCDISKRRRKKKIRRILDDTELGEDTKKKIAIEKVYYTTFFLLTFIVCESYLFINLLHFRNDKNDLNHWKLSV